MDLMEYEKKIHRIFWIVGIIVLFLINYSNIDPSGKLFYISIGLLTFPGILLTLYAVTKIRVSLSDHYSGIREELEHEIEEILRKYRSEKDMESKRDLIEEALKLREIILGFRNNRPINYIVSSLIYLLSSLLFNILNLGPLVDLQNWVVIFIPTFIGVYYIVKTIIEISLIFRED